MAIEWPPAPKRAWFLLTPNLGRGSSWHEAEWLTNQRKKAPDLKPQRKMEAGNKRGFTLLLAGEALAQSRHSIKLPNGTVMGSK